MPKLPRETGSRFRAALAAALLASFALGGVSGCGLFPDPDLRESKRISDCRWNARLACRRLARETESLDVDECVSERAWSCAIGDAKESGEAAASGN